MLGFFDSNQGMRQIAQTVFEMGQTVHARERIDLVSHLPKRNAVTNAVRDAIGKSLILS